MMQQHPSGHLEGFKCRIGACLFAAGHFDALVLSNVLSNPVQAKVSTSDFHDRCEAAKSLQEGIRNIALAIKRRPQFRRSQSFRKRSGNGSGKVENLLDTPGMFHKTRTRCTKCELLSLQSGIGSSNKWPALFLVQAKDS